MYFKAMLLDVLRFMNFTASYFIFLSIQNIPLHHFNHRLESYFF